MAKLTRQLIAQSDATRRFTRRGVARAVLEALAKGDESYFETHEIAQEYRQTYGRRTLHRWATERSPTTGTGTTVVFLGGR